MPTQVAPPTQPTKSANSRAHVRTHPQAHLQAQAHPLVQVHARTQARRPSWPAPPPFGPREMVCIPARLIRSNLPPLAKLLYIHLLISCLEQHDQEYGRMMSDQYNAEYGQAVSDHCSHKQRMSGQLSREHGQGMLAQPYHENDQKMPGQPGHECEKGMPAQAYHENDQRMPGQPGHECEQGMLAQRGHDHQQKMLAQPSHEYGHSLLAQTSHDHRQTMFGQRVTASGWPMPVVLHPYTFYRFALPGLGLPPADKLPLSQCARPVWLGNLATLARDCGISTGTARHCIRALVDAKWIVETKVAPKTTAFTLRNDWLEQRLTELQRVVQRIEHAPYRGEALAKEWSTLLADIDPGSGEVVDNARPEFLVNPDTNQPLEYDRWFKRYGVAIEFNGKQHYGATERYPDVRAAARTRVHDYVKYGLSRDHGVTLITLTPSELNYPTIWRHLAGALPLRSVSLDDPVLQYLTERSHSYARWAERAERTGSEA